MEQSSEPLLKLTRRSQLINRTRPFWVIVDGEKVCKIKNGETIDVPASPGKRTVQVKIDWCSSRALELNLAEGSMVALEAGCKASALLGPLAMIRTLIPHAYLYMKES